jgi:hypothetical protein
MDNYICLNKIIKDTNLEKVCENLNLSKGTINRWLSLKKVPKQYTFDIMKLSGIKIDYSKFEFKDKDQFFTPTSTAEYCYSKFLKIVEKYKEEIGQYIYVEPSAGNGNFLGVLPEDRRIGIDIESLNKEVIISDYMSWDPDKGKKYIVFGNPPFGLRGAHGFKILKSFK